MVMRRLLDGERFSHEGRFYRFTDALCEPRPVQAHLPILVGGSGPRKTLRTVARRADAWNTSGTVDEVREKLAILDEHCAEVGRDRAQIELTVLLPILIRDDVGQAQAAYAATLARNGTDNMRADPILGSPAMVANALRPYRDLGFWTVIVRLPAPYDRQTIERIAEVHALLADG